MARVNIHEHRHRTTVNKNTKVVEQRAPTDDSIRLLKEMQEKVWGQVKDAIPIESQGFKGTVVVRQDMQSFSPIVAIGYELNGVRDTFEHEIRMARAKDGREIVSEIISELGRHIAARMLLDLHDQEHSGLHEALNELRVMM